jgi:hypothetical protein
MFQPVYVTPMPGYRLQLRYADGVEGEVDLSRLVGQGVFALWNDPQAFQSVRLGSHGAVEWSDDVALCSDALYLELTGKTPEEAFPTLQQWPAHA